MGHQQKVSWSWERSSYLFKIEKILKFMIYRVCVFCVLFVTALSGHAYDSLTVRQRADSLFIIHQVEGGETVYSLAQRYHITSDDLMRQNGLKSNALDIGQVLEIQYNKDLQKDSEILSGPQEGQHEVALGETLYAIAKKYNLSLDTLRKMNLLTADELSVGQYLLIKETPAVNDVKDSSSQVLKEETKDVDPPSDSIPTLIIKSEVELDPYIYYVQNGENMDEIAAKFNISRDSIKSYNNLRNNRLKTGQKLLFPPAMINDSTIIKISKVPDYISTNYGSKMIFKEVGGIKKYTEEGLARIIDTELNTPKYLALHRSLGIGTIFEVTNLMNNKVLHVRVVGRLPNTGLNENVMLRLTESVFEDLGIVDKQARMKMVYYK
jgi:LysM repeat protein